MFVCFQFTFKKCFSIFFCPLPKLFLVAEINVNLDPVFFANQIYPIFSSRLSPVIIEGLYKWFSLIVTFIYVGDGDHVQARKTIVGTKDFLSGFVRSFAAQTTFKLLWTFSATVAATHNFSHFKKLLEIKTFVDNSYYWIINRVFLLLLKLKLRKINSVKIL